MKTIPLVVSGILCLALALAVPGTGSGRFCSSGGEPAVAEPDSRGG